ncbi:unnamed protein product, partial [Caenorhabditis auriculariae]
MEASDEPVLVRGKTASTSVSLGPFLFFNVAAVERVADGGSGIEVKSSGNGCGRGISSRLVPFYEVPLSWSREGNETENVFWMGIFQELTR